MNFDNNNIIFLASAVILSIMGRKYIEVEIDETIASRTLFHLLVIFSVIYLNTRSYIASTVGAILMHFLITRTNIAHAKPPKTKNKQKINNGAQ